MFPDHPAPPNGPAPDGDVRADDAPAPRPTAASLLKSLLQIRFVRFLLVAGLNTVFGYTLFAALILIGIWYPVAAALATVIGILFNFQTTGRIVFGSRDFSRILRFFAVYAITYVVGVALLRWGDHRGISVLVMAALLAIPMGFFSYTLQRVLVFRSHR